MIIEEMWVRHQIEGATVRVLFQRAKDGRPEARVLHLIAMDERPLNTTMLQTIPFERMEAWAIRRSATAEQDDADELAADEAAAAQAERDRRRVEQ